MKKFMKIFLLILLILLPVAVFLIFAIGEYWLHFFDLKASDWAAFFAALLSYIGTTSLAYVAYLQNDRLMKLEERDAEIKEIELREKSPAFIVKSIKVENPLINYTPGMSPLSLDFRMYPDPGEYDYSIEGCVNLESEEAKRLLIYPARREDKTSAGELDSLTLDIEVQNFSKYTAYDFEYFELGIKYIGLDESEVKKAEKEGSNVVPGSATKFQYGCWNNGQAKLEPQTVLTMPFDIKKGKFGYCSFNLRYRNLYKDWYHQKFKLTYSWKGSELEYQIDIDDCNPGDADLKKDWKEFDA